MFAICALLAMACDLLPTEPPRNPTPTEPMPLAAYMMSGPDTTVLSSALQDTWIDDSKPNDNYGTNNTLEFGANNGVGRVRLGWDYQDITDAMAGKSLRSAAVQVVVDRVLFSAWGAQGHPVGVHSLNVEWMESATWNCADDTTPSDNKLDCDPADEWDMDNPQSPALWDEPALGTVVVTDSPPDTLEFDATAQVAAFLGGQEGNPGWILKKEDETLGGRLELLSRESSSSPQLVLAAQEVMTSLPPIPDNPIVVDDPVFTIPDPLDSAWVFFRRQFEVQFLASASDSLKLDWFNTFQATVAGGDPFFGHYVVRVPDPGSDWRVNEAFLSTMFAHPAVDWITRGVFRSPPEPSRRRFPEDGAITRQDWLSQSAIVEPWYIVRALDAWGCETGSSSGRSTTKLRSTRSGDGRATRSRCTSLSR